MNISSLLQTITLIMGTYTWFMRNSNHWTCLKSIKLKLKINRIEKLKPLDLIVMVSTMEETTDQIDVQDHLSISKKVWHCRLIHHVRDTSSEWYCWEWNHTLKDMLKSMIDHTTLPESLWSEALKMVVYLLKIITKTPYELWTGKSHSIRHLHV